MIFSPSQNKLWPSASSSSGLCCSSGISSARYISLLSLDLLVALWKTAAQMDKKPRRKVKVNFWLLSWNLHGSIRLPPMKCRMCFIPSTVRIWLDGHSHSTAIFWFQDLIILALRSEGPNLSCLLTTRGTLLPVFMPAGIWLVGLGQLLRRRHRKPLWDGQHSVLDNASSLSLM